jgi:hypothetical protein
MEESLIPFKKENPIKINGFSFGVQNVKKQLK